MHNFIAENHQVLIGIVLGVAGVLLYPLVDLIPHYTWAILANLYLDIKHFGLVGTFKYRTTIKPTKQTIVEAIDWLWDMLRMIPLPPLQRALDKECDKVVRDFGNPVGKERMFLQDEGIPVKENKALHTYLDAIEN